MGIQGTGGVRCQPPLASSLIASTSARSCPGACPSPTTHPTMSPMAQDPDSLCCHFIKGHPLNGAHVLPFLHGLPHALLQRHGGLQASQGAKHWAVSPQGQSLGTAQPNCQPHPAAQGLHGPHPCQIQAQEGEMRVSGEQRQAFLVPGATTSHSLEDACPLPGYSWDTLAGGGLPSHIKRSPINAGGQAPVYQLTGLRSPRILLPRSPH